MAIYTKSIDGPPGDLRATCLSLTGDRLATWTIAEDDLGNMAMRRIRVELSLPGLRLLVVLPGGALLAEQRTWAELFQS